MRRRRFLAATAGATFLAACGKGKAPLPPGEMLGTSHALGHRLRENRLAAPVETRRLTVAIVGAGVAGVCAAYRLASAGFRDFELFELEDRPGGNARSGRNEVSAFPWGAHYIPLPTREARSTRRLLADAGILQGDLDAAAPRYDERSLVQAPQERLFRHGTWTEGLAPLEGFTAQERSEWARFGERVERYQSLRGADGRPAFALPVDYSSRDAALLALDRVTFASWLREQGFSSEPVHWIANYACRDDYGTDYREVSAWAGIHYFACRTGAALHADRDAVLTWPAGNGHVLDRLMAKHPLRVTTGALAHRLEERRRQVSLDVLLAAEDRSIRIEAEHVIWAAPLHLAARADPASPARAYAALLDYAPWVTANLTLSEPPHVHHGAPLSWDNVIYDSTSLGYVVATHQGLASRPGPTVLTWYRPLASERPREARARLLASSREAWAGEALADLARPHPEIAEITRRVDVFANGHAMIRPVPGVLWSAARAAAARGSARVGFAHADASGLSLFEEAADRGIAAAERVLRAMGSSQASWRHPVDA